MSASLSDKVLTGIPELQRHTSKVNELIQNFIPELREIQKNGRNDTATENRFIEVRRRIFLIPFVVLIGQDISLDNIVRLKNNLSFFILESNDVPFCCQLKVLIHLTKCNKDIRDSAYSEVFTITETHQMITYLLNVCGVLTYREKIVPGSFCLFSAFLSSVKNHLENHTVVATHHIVVK